MAFGKWPEAEELLRKAVTASPLDPEPHRDLAEALWHKGARDEALAQLDEAQRLSPEDAGIRVRLGEMRLALGQWDAAYQDAETAVDLDPKLPAGWALRGSVEAGQGFLDQSLADFHRALSLSGEDREVLRQIAELYRRLDQPSRALVTLQAWLDTYPPGEEPAEAFYLLGLAQSAMGIHREALESFRAARDKGPPSADLLFRLAEAEFRSGSEAEAQSSARQALALDPQHVAAHELLARIDRLQAAANSAVSR